MGNSEKLNQLIRGQRIKINQNPFSLSGNLYPKISDGVGGFKKSGSPLTQSYINPVRISKGFIDPGSPLGKAEPKSDDQNWIIEADAYTTLDVGLEFDYKNLRFRILHPVLPYFKFGGTYGYGANLQKINSEEDIL